MIVDNGQRMTQATPGKRHVTLEVHLPHQVCRLLLEPRVRLSRRASGRFDPAVAAYDCVNGGDRRRRVSVAFKAAEDFTRPPRRVGITHRQNRSLDRTLGPQWARMGATGTIRKLPIGSPAAEPLVANLGADPEPPTQLPPVAPLLHRKTNKLTPLVHDQHLAPRHGWPPSQP